MALNAAPLPWPSRALLVEVPISHLSVPKEVFGYVVRTMVADLAKVET